MFLNHIFLKHIVLSSVLIVAFGTSPAYALIFSPVQFESYDGTLLDGQLFTPDGYSSGDSFPAMVLIPGWTLPKQATYSNAIEFAQRGFVVLAYSPRGYGASEGMVNVAGPKDREDFSSAIDWLLDNTKTDPARIGSGGVSYGGIVPAMGASFDDRISALAMMDMPAEIIDTFYAGETPNAFWTQMLELTSHLGNPEPIIRQNLEDLFAHRRIPEVIAWALERTPMEHIDRINARQVPVFMSFGYRDRMFRPNSGLRYFNALTGPKLLQLHDGIHGMPSGSSGDYRSEAYFDWFDYWLNDADNGVMDRPMADFQIHGTDERAQYDQWPSPLVQTIGLYLSPNATNLIGDLLKEPNVLNDIWALDSFFANQEDLQPTTGRPLIDAENDLYLDFASLDPDLAHSYQSDFLPDGLKLRGTPKVNLRIQAWDEQVQVIAYLYQINPDGQALFLTQGAKTFYELFPGELVDFEVELTTLIHDFPPGSRVGLAFDTQDPQYIRPPQRFFTLDVLHSQFVPNQLWLPIEGELITAGTNESPITEESPTEQDDTDANANDRATADNSSAAQGGGSGGGVPIELLLVSLSAVVLRRKFS